MRALPPVRLALRRSRMEMACLIALNGLAMFMPWVAALPLIVQLGLDACVLCAIGYWAWRWRQPYPLSLRLLNDGNWALGWPQSALEVEAVQLHGVYLTAHLVVLPLRLPGDKVLRLALWPDSTDADDFRRLRVWLRWGTLAEPATASDQEPA